MSSDLKLARGTVLGDEFEVVAPLARGGMGYVYRAQRRSTGETVAVKVMHAQLVGDARSRERFTREAELCARIDSPHVVRVFASGITALDDGVDTPWLAMELVDGDDLEKLSRQRGALPLDEARELLRQLFDGVAAAHRVGIVHRDLKPQNVLLSSTGEAIHLKVLDFGISKQSSETGTETTAAVGSPLWMAPEQAQRGRLTPATDVFALALAAFRVLAGKAYWLSAAQSRPTLKETLVELLVKPYPPASARSRELGGAELPAGFDAWFERAASRDPAKRYADAGAAWQGLSAVLDGRPLPVDAPPPTPPTSPTTPLPPTSAEEPDAAAVPLVRRASSLRSPTPAPLPQLLDAARDSRAEGAKSSPALVAVTAVVAVVLLVALVLVMTRG